MNSRLATCLLAVVCASPAFGQRVITTFAGADWLFPGDGRPAVQAPLGGIFSLDIATDRNGNYYICDSDNDMVMRVGPDGIINVVAGNGLVGLSGDGGLAVNASLDIPQGIAVDLSGNLYITEFGGRVRKVTPDGIITTLAGNGTAGYSGDRGPATQAQLFQPTGVAVDSAGNVYIADTGNHVIRRVSPDGTIATVAGNNQQGFLGDRGPATSAKLNQPTRVVVDSSGNLYIVELFNGRIRKVANGIIDTLAGGGSSFAEGIRATSAGLIPTAVAVDSAGNVYIDDVAVAGVRKVDLQGNITTIAGGSGTPGFAGDGGPALKALFSFGIYSGLAVDSTGAILVGDDQNRRVRKITADRNINTVAGNGLYRFSGDGGPATSATLYFPTSVIADAAGNVFISETGQNRIRKVAPDGTISVYAGTGLNGYSGDNGPATKATLSFPTYMGIGIDGNLYFSDGQNHVIRRVDKNGVITTVAGNGLATYGGDDKPPTQASFASPSGIDFDPAGEMLIADTGNNRIRLVTADRAKVLTLAGNGDKGYSGDNGSSLKAVLNKPVGLAFFDAVYFCDSGNNVVRRISATDLTITTVAGNGKAGYSGDDGQAKNAMLNNPQGLTFDADGNLYIADQSNFVVRKVTPTGIITTFAGSPTANSIGDGGVATNAFLRGPTDVTVDLAGNVFIAESPGHHIREVLAAAPSFQVSSNNVAFTAPAGSGAVDQTVSLAGSIPGVAYMATVPASSSWLTVSPAIGSMPTALRIAIDPSRLSPGSNQANITVTAPNAKPPTATIAVTLTVSAPGQPSLNVQPASLTFSFVQQSAARSRTVTVSNAGGGSLTVQVATAVNAPRAWLTTSASGITVGAFGSNALNVTADPSGLNPGTYTGSITFSSTSPAQSITVPVTMTVSAVPQTILIPQTGLTFFAVQGGGPTAPQFFNILNTGRGQMRWSVKASTLTGGPWLTAFPGNGVSDAASPLVPTVRLDVDPRGLAAGIYAGTVQVSATEADNTPQFVSVFLNVLAPGSKIGPVVQPSAMIFAAAAGGESPGSQSVLVQSLSSASVTFNSGSVTADGKNWLTVLPRDGAVTAAQPVRIVVQPNIQGLSPGVYRATLTLAFSDGNTRNIAVVLVLIPPGSRLPSSATLEQAQASCTPKTLIPVFTLLLDGFSIPAGFPGQIAVKVIDDCANPMTTGNVQVSFGNGDPDVRLDSLKDGTWAQTWIPQRNTSPVTVTAKAEIPEQKLTGQVQIKGGLLTFDTPPVVGSGAVVNGASFAPQSPVAPGSLISIFGNKLAQGQALAGTLPLPLNLAGSSVILAGVASPMLFANDGQVNAVVPFETAVNTPQHIVLMRGTSPSVPQSITVAPAAPGVFTKDSSGKGQGVIFGVDASGAQILADSARPVKAGDVVVIYCTGLGRVDPPVPTGSPAPITPLSNAVNPVTVSVGGASADVSFKGLTPGFVGLYQINATIPQGVTPGNQVPVVVTAAGQPSLPVTIAVR